MNKEIKNIEWEDIFSLSRESGLVQFNTARAKVKGGWIITHNISFRQKIANSICFLPDEYHEWELKQ